MYQDKEITCACGAKFTWTAKSQEFFAGKGYQDPKRCRPCVDKKKAGYAERESKPKQEESPFHPSNWGGKGKKGERARHSDREFIEEGQL